MLSSSVTCFSRFPKRSSYRPVGNVKIGVTSKNTAVLVWLVYFILRKHDYTERLCKLEVSRHNQSQLAHELNIENFIYYNCGMLK